MLKSIKILFAAGACVALLPGVSASAETVWKPPAEIAQKAAESGATPAPSEAAPAAAPAGPVSQADKEKSCKEQAAAKGLKGKAKKQFSAECLKS
ncbi:PsiF family protein [Methylocystis sp. JAN1]|uniref:PsiF family protein n=1 Tax=Methylocystis sp. JAN1 TaxID=3397211 RepID=UPI003FA1BFD5